jgi:hypothetical protein
MAGCSMAQHIARIESEDGKKFTDILFELAASGESKSSSAEILDIPQTTLCKWLRNNPQCIEWPAKNSSNGFMENVRNSTPARQAARLINLKLSCNHKLKESRP